MSRLCVLCKNQLCISCTSQAHILVIGVPSTSWCIHKSQVLRALRVMLLSVPITDVGLRIPDFEQSDRFPLKAVRWGIILKANGQ